MKNFRKNQGITLIALVITVIVLLILAGVSIATLTGDNGLLSKAQEAKEETEKASDRDKLAMAVSEAQIGESGYQELDSNNLQEAIDNQFNERNVVIVDTGDGTFTVSCLDTLKDYKITSNGIEEGIDWNETMANAVAPASQDEERNEGVIGIGTDGKPVDMDLWEYTLLENGTFALNTKECIETNSSAMAKTGYKGIMTEDGKIQGTIPQYISIDNAKTFQKVTNLKWLFFNRTDLKVMPNIPVTVTDLEFSFRNCTNLNSTSYIPSSVIDMTSTFLSCSKLQTIRNIPNSVIELYNTFSGCSMLKNVPDIPNSVKNMKYAFYDCSELIVAPFIPDSVITMELSFYNCIKLTTVPVIPNSVENMYKTFYNCYSLNGIIEINANITGKMITDTENDYFYVFRNAATNDNCSIQLTGTCKVLENIVLETDSDRVTML